MRNPVYLSQSPSSNFPFVELKEDQHLEHLTQTPHDQQAAASSTSFPHDHHYCAFTQDQRGKHFSGESHQTQHKVNTHDLGADISSVEHVTAPSSLITSPPGIDSSSRSDDGSVRWMATKVRLGIGKMVNYSATSTNRDTRSVVVQENSHEELNISSSNGSTVRVCSDCNTTKTPLWRSGPRGPKSLCNACGIRQRKARRAMVAPAEAASNGTVDVGGTSSYKLENKEKKSRTSYHDSQIKKQCTNITTTSPGNEKKINKFEDLAMISLSKNSASRRVFPRDVEEAAILLMALSCGLIHG